MLYLIQKDIIHPIRQHFGFNIFIERPVITQGFILRILKVNGDNLDFSKID